MRLVKTETVLHNSTPSFCFEELDPDASVVEVVLSPEAWIEMGRPTTITVTVEPDDRLNDRPCGGGLGDH